MNRYDLKTDFLMQEQRKQLQKKKNAYKGI
jgi:hypothetical protein